MVASRPSPSNSLRRSWISWIQRRISDDPTAGVNAIAASHLRFGGEREASIWLRPSRQSSLPPPFSHGVLPGLGTPPCNSQASGRGFPSHYHPAQSTASTHQIKFWPPYPVAVQGLCLCFLHAATNSILLPHGSGVGMPELLTRTSHFLSSKRCGRQIGRDLRAIVVRVAAWGGMIRLHAVFSPPRATEPSNDSSNVPPTKFHRPPTSCQEEPHVVGAYGCGGDRASLLGRSPPPMPLFAPSRTSMLSTPRD